MFIKDILSLAEQTLSYENSHLFNGNFYICNTIKKLHGQGTITDKEMNRTLAYIRKHRPSKDKYVKFYKNIHYNKNEYSYSWWDMAWYYEDEHMKEIIEQKKLFLKHLIARLCPKR
jgi:hypothetical protein